MLLRPDPEITRIIIYSLIVASFRYGIQVHALCAMSTHIHLVITDPYRCLPLFLAMFHRLVALSAKVVRAWDGAVWDSEQASVVELLTRQAIVEKIAYTLANPVNAGLVRHAHEWPGAKIGVSDIGHGELRASRPDVYFNPKNPEWVPDAKLRLSIPPVIAKEDVEAFRNDIAKELAHIEVAARKVIPRTKVLGAKRAANSSPYDRVASYEPIRKRNPTFAVGRHNPEPMKRAAARVRIFRTAYRAALDAWRAGKRDIAFPSGTYWMNVFHKAMIQSTTN